LRLGRFGEKIYVPPPDLVARKKLFELYLKNRPLSNDINYDTKDLKRFEEYSFNR